MSEWQQPNIVRDPRGTEILKQTFEGLRVIAQAIPEIIGQQFHEWSGRTNSSSQISDQTNRSY